jgi:hypothetical protein
MTGLGTLEDIFRLLSDSLLVLLCHTKRRNQKGQFFSLSPRERVGVRDNQSEKTF